MSRKMTKVKCNECKHEFILKVVGIHEVIVRLNGVPATLVYFACPKCNKIYYISISIQDNYIISIQDKRYYKLLKDFEKAKKKIRRNHDSNNNKIARMLNSIFTRKHKHLKVYVDEANKMFPETFTFVASKNNHKEQIIKLSTMRIME